MKKGMNVKLIQKFYMVILFTVIIVIILSYPITANAAQFQEVCFTEEVTNNSYTEQRFVIVDASGAVTEYVYKYKGLWIKETNPLGEIITYEYDALDRLSKTTTPDGTVINYGYDSSNRQVNFPSFAAFKCCLILKVL